MSCTRSSAFALQPHQLFLKSAVPFVDRLLLFHGIGSGKTCSAISIAAAFRANNHNKNKIVVVVPASLRANFVKELKGSCGTYQKQKESFYDIMSYQGFVKRIKNKSLKLNNTLVIVDEVQNIVSETGETYKVFLHAFQKMQNSKLVLLSATPMFDKTIEISLLGNLLLSKEEYDRYHLPLNPVAFSRMMSENPKVLYTFFKHRVSYFRGADPRAYPSKTEHRVDCVMSKFQRHVYMESIGHIDIQNMDKQLQRAFLIAPRQLSNLVLPNGNVGKLTNVKKTFNVKKFSSKFYKCIQKIKESPGPVFVYSNFVTVAGIEAFTTILSKVHGFSEVSSRKPGLKYGVFRANKPKENDKLLALYNSPENRDGSLVKVIVGSPTMKEGVTLLRTRQIHVLDPYWNRSRTEQIMGRGVRFCSHADLPPNERHVDVFHYYAVPSEKEKELSVDLRILKLSNDKIRKINIVETILKETAVDCPLFKDRNEPPAIHCFNHDIVSDEERKRLMTIKNLNHNSKAKQTINNAGPSGANTGPSGANAGPSGANAGPSGANAGPSSDKKKPKPMRFGAKSAARKMGPKTTCPAKRRVNPKTNECPRSHPYKRPNAKGDMCCFARNKTQTTVKRCRPDQIINPRTKRCVLRNTKLGRLLAQSQEV